MTDLTHGAPSGCQVVVKSQDTAPRWGSALCGSGEPKVAQGVTGPARRLGPSVSQALGHPGPTGSCRRSESGVEAPQAGCSPGHVGRGE